MEFKETVKRAVLDSGLDREYSRIRKSAFRGDYGPMAAFLETYGFDVARICRNLCSSNWQRVRRVRSKTEATILSGVGYFITLTFRDDVLSSTSEKTRRRYVSRQLKAESQVYVANIDFGDENGREHYHALVQAEDRPRLNWWKRNCGFVKIQHIGDTKADLDRVAKYTAKLSRHALKKSTSKDGAPKAPRLIYSRKAY